MCVCLKGLPRKTFAQPNFTPGLPRPLEPSYIASMEQRTTALPDAVTQGAEALSDRLYTME